jgi:peptidoglycan/LPS O-acetylase OafA/YrhL
MGTGASRSYQSLQACRGIAALLVALYHLGIAIASPRYFGISGFAVPLSFGHTGVDFFFVLSGFIITYVHWQDISRPSSLPRYLNRRFVRIYPIYWIIFVVVFLAALVIPATRDSVPHDVSFIMKGLGLIPTDWRRHASTPVIVVSWSLEYEVLFYLVFALAIINRWLLAIPIAMLSFAYISCANGCEFPQSFVTSTISWLFVMGAAIAVCERKRLVVRKPLAIAALGAILFFSFGIAEILDPPFRATAIQHVLLGLASCLAIAGLLSWEKAKSYKISLGPLVLLGDASYVLYLVHYPLIIVLCKLAVLLLPRTLIGAAIAYPTILMLCLLTVLAVHLWIEKPLLHNLGKNREAAVTTP